MHKNNPPEKQEFPGRIPVAKCATYGYPSREWRQRAERLKGIQHDNYKSGRFSRKGKLTFCNRKFLKDALDFGCDITAISPKRTIYPTSTAIYSRVKNKNLWTVGAEMAFYLAQYGVFAGAVTPMDLKINGKPYNHIAPIYPRDEKYDSWVGPYVCQAGWYEGIFPISDRRAWGPVWRNAMMIYFILPLSVI